ncbi:1-acyl-sn-glycerol-3-phosphate acyltransferase [Anopheles sinensis]|uniref:1-acyl-sn-glycerol-3-phosphate acyltransferase n=1 Tax=Anopheles sinensis TaxID=74873 RepID=A0A084WHN6_ANOSI|nr:1-acyl-sn-glycerol-3-phosphate acyltransferase [Anopheles sinensis]
MAKNEKPATKPKAAKPEQPVNLSEPAGQPEAKRMPGKAGESEAMQSEGTGTGSEKGVQVQSLAAKATEAPGYKVPPVGLAGKLPPGLLLAGVSYSLEDPSYRERADGKLLSARKRKL